MVNSTKPTILRDESVRYYIYVIDPACSSFRIIGEPLPRNTSVEFVFEEIAAEEVIRPVARGPFGSNPEVIDLSSD